MNKSFNPIDLRAEPDTIFGTGEFTGEDRAAMQQFMAESRKKPENIAAVQAMKALMMQPTYIAAQEPIEPALAPA